MCDDANIYIVRTRLVQTIAYFCENPKHPRKGTFFFHQNSRGNDITKQRARDIIHKTHTHEQQQQQQQRNNNKH